MIRFVCSLLLLIQFHGYAQYSNTDFYPKDSVDYKTISRWQKIQNKLDTKHSRDLFKISCASLPLIAGGLVVKKQDHYFYNLRNEHVPSFKYRYDDIIEYVPAVAMLGLKIGGVEGRSSWNRMLVSDAFSVAIVAGAVNGLKYSTKVMRPDGSKRNSFPSGHTAVAFITATMLHKEYGLTRSPWYSVGGYSIATATGVSRMLNNRHWLSDVLVGAGIGILSTEMGYFIADLIFKDKGIKSYNREFDSFDANDKPSSFGLYMGFDIISQDINLAPNFIITPYAGSSAGLEGAWFMNSYFGLGGRFSASSTPLKVKEMPNFPQNSSVETIVETQPGSFNQISAYIGPNFSYPVANRILLGTKLHVGGNFSPKNTISYAYKTGNGTELRIKDIATTDRSFHIGYNTGASIMYVMKHNLGVKLFLDYKISPIRFVTEFDEVYDGGSCFEQRNTLHTFTVGASVNVMLK